METIQKEFFSWLCETFGFAPGVNAFQNRVPTTNQTGDGSLMWLIEDPGYVTRQFVSSSKLKEYNFSINYRNVRARDVELKLLEMEQVINHLKCFTLPSYKVIQIQANSFGADEDPDAEKFMRGTVSVMLVVLDNYEETDESS